MLQLVFIDSFSSLQLDLTKYDSVSVQGRIRIIESTLDSLHSSTSRGFVNKHDLANFPVVSEILPTLLIEGGDGLEYQHGLKSMESYK